MPKNKSNTPIFTLRCGRHLLAPTQPVVMGILNITPDSFYAGSRVPAINEVITKAGAMLAQGATILDVGGQSTRPGSPRLTAGEEYERVVPAIMAITAAYPDAIVSIDTYHAVVAAAAITAGATIVNDISAGLLDPAMLPTVAALGTPYICMHMQGEPATMQAAPHYDHLLRELVDFFVERVAACRAAGITDIIIDPGFGFGKTMAHNFELLQHLDALHILQLPLLVGVSRKSFVYKSLGLTAAEALNGTTVVHTMALLKGAQLLRVHDVAEAVQAVRLLELTLSPHL